MCSIQSPQLGWGEGAVAGGWWRGFREELADGCGVAINIAVGGQVLVQEGCCKRLHGRVAEHG